MKKISLLCVLALALCAVASANIIPSLISGSPTGTAPGPFTWTYDFQLSGDQNALVGAAPSSGTTGSLVSNTFTGLGAFVTIYDFAGYNGTCGGPTGWTCTSQPTGFTPTLVSPVDSSLVNITWTHTSGSDVIGQGLTSSTDLGAFTAQSSVGAPVIGWFTSRAVKNTAGTNGTIGSNVGNVMVPTGVPEPATMGLIGLGLVGLGLLRRKARKS